MSIVIRPYVPGQDDDLRVDLYNRAHAEDEDFVPADVEENRRWDQSPLDPHRHRFMAELDGVPAGLAVAEVDPDRKDATGTMGGPHVPPEQRRRGVGTALARAAFADLVSRGMPQVEVQELDRADINGFLESLGFTPVRAFSRMRRPLRNLPHGIGESAEAEIEVVEPTRENLEVNLVIENEAYKEHFNFRPLKLAELEFWTRMYTEDGTVFHMSFARVAGRPVGYLWYGFDPKNNAHLGKNQGWLMDIGVLKPWRNRGIAKALMLAAMRHLQSEGMDEVRLYVDDSNVTGAHHLYDRLGFALAYRDIVRRKDLGAAGKESA
jgi:mycothiol synthase